VGRDLTLDECVEEVQELTVYELGAAGADFTKPLDDIIDELAQSRYEEWVQGLVQLHIDNQIKSLREDYDEDGALV
jgi:hypothetical protein